MGSSPNGVAQPDFACRFRLLLIFVLALVTPIFLPPQKATIEIQIRSVHFRKTHNFSYCGPMVSKWKRSNKTKASKGLDLNYLGFQLFAFRLHAFFLLLLLLVVILFAVSCLLLSLFFGGLKCNIWHELCSRCSKLLDSWKTKYSLTVIWRKELDSSGHRHFCLYTFLQHDWS